MRFTFRRKVPTPPPLVAVLVDMLYSVPPAERYGGHWDIGFCTLEIIKDQLTEAIVDDWPPYLLGWPVEVAGKRGLRFVSGAEVAWSGGFDKAASWLDANDGKGCYSFVEAGRYFTVTEKPVAPLTRNP